MMRWIIGLALAGAALLVAGVLGLGLLWGDGLQPCGNTAVETLPSPDGRLEAVLFERSCGATTGFSTQISVMPAGEAPEDSGNIFVTGDDVPSGEEGDWGGAWADVQWLSDRHLHIDHAPNAQVFKSLNQFGEVTVTYGSARPPRQSGSDDADRSAAS